MRSDYSNAPLSARDHQGLSQDPNSSAQRSEVHFDTVIGSDRTNPHVDNLSARGHASPLSSAPSLASRDGFGAPGQSLGSFQAAPSRDGNGAVYPWPWQRDTTTSAANASQAGLTRNINLGRGGQIPSSNAAGHLQSQTNGSVPSSWVAASNVGHHVNADFLAAPGFPTARHRGRPSPLESGFSVSPMTDAWLTPHGAPAVQHETGYEQGLSLSPRDVTFEAAPGNALETFEIVPGNMQPSISRKLDGQPAARGGLTVAEPVHVTPSPEKKGQSPHLSTSFMAVLRGQGTQRASRRLPAGSVPSQASGTANASATAASINAQKDMEHSSSGYAVAPATGPSVIAPQPVPTNTATGGLRPVPASLVERTQSDSHSGQQPISESVTAPSLAVSSAPASNTRASGFSRAQALLAAIERSIREHPPMGINDRDLFSLGAGHPDSRHSDSWD